MSRIYFKIGLSLPASANPTAGEDPEDDWEEDDDSSEADDGKTIKIENISAGSNDLKRNNLMQNLIFLNLLESA